MDGWKTGYGQGVDKHPVSRVQVFQLCARISFREFIKES